MHFSQMCSCNLFIHCNIHISTFGHKSVAFKHYIEDYPAAAPTLVLSFNVFIYCVMKDIMSVG